MTMLMYRGPQKDRFARIMAAAETPAEQTRLFHAMRFAWEDGATVALTDSGRPVVDLIDLDPAFVEATVI